MKNAIHVTLLLSMEIRPMDHTNPNQTNSLDNEALVNLAKSC